MNRPIVIIGIGEIAGVLAKAFLRSGHPIFPITRGMDLPEAAAEISDPLMVVVGVAEKDFSAVMDSIPDLWRDRLVLIQNELLPRDWEAFGVQEPTVMSVWFEKKKGMEYHPILPSPIYGPAAGFIAKSLQGIEIPCTVLDSGEDLLLDLVRKNVFILTINISGLALEEGTTTSMLWENEQQLALEVANNVIDLQEAVIGQKLSRDKLLIGLVKGLEGDPHHKCKGRSAPDRLARAIEIADEKGVEIKAIRSLSQRLEQN